ncbi:hypothetical protein BKA69DRAFT_872759 [Paraphysoderma sedebokerense]|nr:hypothetical protein BKA69DRAFT_872759 [Paraphysoderma sedebokerense]
MPLAYPIGPKQTKVLYSEEVVEIDLESKLIIRATSQTPDVPAGTSFSTITIIGVTYTTPTSIKLTVATYVAWTKSSWFKSTVESGAVEGNTKYYKNLIAELRLWIKQYGRSIPVADDKKSVQDRRTRKQTKETETEGDDRIDRKSRRRRHDLKSTSKRKRTKSVSSPTATSPETPPHPLLSTILGSFQSYLFPSSTTPQISQPTQPKTKSRRKSSNSKDPNAQKSPTSSTPRSKSSKTKRKSSTSTSPPPSTLLQSLQSMRLQNILNMFLLFLILGNIWVGVWMWKRSSSF